LALLCGECLMPDNIAISVRDVSKNFKLPHERASGLKQVIINHNRDRGYEIQEVLKDISFDIKKGEFFGIVGRNGSGKSTLLKLLAHIYTPNTGRVTVYLNGALLGFDRKQMDAMYADVVNFAELGRFMDQKLKNYSSGMQV